MNVGCFFMCPNKFLLTPLFSEKKTVLSIFKDGFLITLFRTYFSKFMRRYSWKTFSGTALSK